MRKPTRVVLLASGALAIGAPAALACSPQDYMSPAQWQALSPEQRQEITSGGANGGAYYGAVESSSASGGEPARGAADTGTVGSAATDRGDRPSAAQAPAERSAGAPSAGRPATEPAEPGGGPYSVTVAAIAALMVIVAGLLVVRRGATGDAAIAAAPAPVTPVDPIEAELQEIIAEERARAANAGCRPSVPPGGTAPAADDIQARDPDDPL